MTFDSDYNFKQICYKMGEKKEIGNLKFQNQKKKPFLLAGMIAVFKTCGFNRNGK